MAKLALLALVFPSVLDVSSHITAYMRYKILIYYVSMTTPPIPLVANAQVCFMVYGFSVINMLTFIAHTHAREAVRS